MFKKMKDPFSSLTHLSAAFLSAIFTALLIYKGLVFSVFGLALVLLYTASAVYHMLPVSEKISNVLRRIDHMMIFVLIAGTYTPICLVPLHGQWGWSLLAVIWLLALAGIILKACWLNAPRWLSTTIYLFMGWFVMVAFYPLTRTVSAAGIFLLILGGVVYSIGAVIYALKWPKFNIKWFGFHELFHLFVMGGSGFHLWFMFKYI